MIQCNMIWYDITCIQENSNRPQDHTPDIPKVKIWKDSFHKQVIQGPGYVPQGCWNLLKMYVLVQSHGKGCMFMGLGEISEWKRFGQKWAVPFNINLWMIHWYILKWWMSWNQAANQCFLTLRLVPFVFLWGHGWGAGVLSGVLGFGASDASEKLEANLCRFGSQVS